MNAGAARDQIAAERSGRAALPPAPSAAQFFASPSAPQSHGALMLHPDDTPTVQPSKLHIALIALGCLQSLTQHVLRCDNIITFPLRWLERVQEYVRYNNHAALLPNLVNANHELNVTVCLDSSHIHWRIEVRQCEGLAVLSRC
jgi:hypothetical protein